MLGNTEATSFPPPSSPLPPVPNSLFNPWISVLRPHGVSWTCSRVQDTAWYQRASKARFSGSHSWLALSSTAQTWLEIGARPRSWNLIDSMLMTPSKHLWPNNCFTSSGLFTHCTGLSLQLVQVKQDLDGRVQTARIALKHQSYFPSFLFSSSLPSDLRLPIQPGDICIDTPLGTLGLCSGPCLVSGSPRGQAQWVAKLAGNVQH